MSGSKSTFTPTTAFAPSSSALAINSSFAASSALPISSGCAEALNSLNFLA
ncbi:MAG: hypothetical protein AAF599_19650 [Bacteroidota bacterium]